MNNNKNWHFCYFNDDIIYVKKLTATKKYAKYGSLPFIKQCE